METTNSFFWDMHTFYKQIDNCELNEKNKNNNKSIDMKYAMNIM
jgi:hypothetical protein